MDIYVLNRDLTRVGIVDSYVSAIWRPAYYDIGDFELYLGASTEAVNLLQKNMYLVRSTDITVDASGNTTYKNVMIIKNLELITDAENGDFLNVTGRELKFLLHQRIIWNQTNLTGTAVEAINQLITENALVAGVRNIPLLALGTYTDPGDSIEKQVTGEYLDETIVDICTTYYYGWEMYIYNSSLVFNIYYGLDRSYNQTERPYVVFSDDFDNLYNTDYQLTTEDYANTTLVGGQGEGTERFYTTVNNTNSGLDRYEFFTDANDLSQNKDSSDPNEVISDADYTLLLQERGKEKLAELAVTEGFSGEVSSDVAFTYGKDFFIGDTVTVINSYGISRNVNVLSAIESTDDNGTKLLPQFNM